MVDQWKTWTSDSQYQNWCWYVNWKYPNCPKIICQNCLPYPKKLGFQRKKISFGVCSPWFEIMTGFVVFNIEFGFLSIEFILVKSNLDFGAKSFSFPLKSQIIMIFQFLSKDIHCVFSNVLHASWPFEENVKNQRDH